MKNLIPHFIAEKYRQNVFSGQFQAVTMFLDISGFTAMTEKLMSEGREGAEVLSEIINNVFEPVIKAVYEAEGFISTFAGDAFTAVFPNLHKGGDAVSCADKIRDIFHTNGKQKTRFGEFGLFVKLGLSSGNVEWGILGADKHKTYYFKGEAIDGCAHAEHRCGKMEIVLDDKLSKFLESGLFETDPGSVKALETGRIPAEILEIFVPEQIINQNQQGEFREIVSVFISFKEPEDRDFLGRLTAEMITASDFQGGYFNKMDFGDKGGVALVLFGAPVSHENNLVRALNFVTQIRQSFGKAIRAGITTGIAYCGIVGGNIRSEYTALGDVVNQSARFMMKAEPGDIWLSEPAVRKISRLYLVKDLGRMEFKGKKEPVQVYSLDQKIKDSESGFFTGEMVGRAKELELLKEHASFLGNGRFAGILTVYGEAGMGKSRLVYELTQSLTDAQILLLQTDSILKISMNPFKYFLRSYFNPLEAEDKETRKKNFEDAYNKLLDELSRSDDPRAPEIMRELKRTISIISAQIDIFYENSLYKQLEPKGRFENTLFAYKELFKALSLLKPIVIEIEDIHWLDEDSQKVFQTLCRSIEDYPVMIIATGRFNDDGTKPQIRADKEVLQKEIVLDKLEKSAACSFIELLLEGKADHSLLELINGKTEYNPFYIEQFISYLKENGLLVLENGLYRIGGTDIEIPDTVSAIIISRIDRLENELKNIVQVASVLGREVELKLLLALLEMYQTAHDQNRIIKYLEEIESDQIWSKLAEIKYIFKHALLHEAVYEMQLKSRIRELHELAARSLQNIYGEAEDKYYEIAVHYDNAENGKQAMGFYKNAGQHYYKNYENLKAVECFDRYLILAENTDADKKGIYKVAFDKSKTLELIGKWDEAKEVYETCHKIAVDLNDEVLIGESKNEIGRLMMNRGQYKEAMDIFEQTYKTTKINDDEKLKSDVLNNLGLLYLEQGDYEKSIEFFTELKKLSLKKGHKSNYTSAVNNIGMLHLYQGELEKAMENFQEAKKTGLETGEKYAYSCAVGNMGLVYYDQGDHDKSMQCFEEELNTCLELGDRYGYSNAVGNLGVLYAEQGDYIKALRYHKEKEQICLELGDKNGYATAIGNIGLIHNSLGEFEKAIQCFEVKKLVSLETGSKLDYSIAVANTGVVHTKLGDFEEAMKCFGEAIEIFRDHNSKAWLCRSLYQKANILFIIREYEKSESLNSETKTLADELQMKQWIFSSTILGHKLQALEKPEEAVSSLIHLSETETGEEDIALIHYEIYKINYSDQHRKIALDIYQKLYQNTPMYDYKKKIEELSR